MNRTLGGIAAAMCVVTLSWGLQQEAPPQPQPIPTTRVRVLDMRRVILLCNEGKKATSELNKRIASRNAELEKRQKEHQDLQKQWEASAADAQKRGELGALIEKSGKEINRLKDDYTAELQQAESEMLNSVGKKVLKVIEEHSKKQGYDLVLHSSQDGSVLWYPPAMDITDELVAAVNLAGPAKAASSGSVDPATAVRSPR